MFRIIIKLFNLFIKNSLFNVWYWLLSQSTAGKIVKTPAELGEYVEKLLADEEFYKQACKDCETIFQDQQGALDVVINELKEIL